MSAKEYARTMREECYRQNKNIMEVTADLWLEIADNIENLANQAVEDYKNEVIKQLEERRDYCYAEMKKQECKDIQEVEPLYFEQMHNQGMAYNNALEILKSAANATNGKNGGLGN